MPNVASVFRQEIVRLARKESKQQLAPPRSQIAQQRRQIAALRKQVSDLAREVRRLSRQHRGNSPANPAVSAGALRFRASGLRSHRNRLRLSASDLGKLLGVSAQTVYNWEAGSTRPRRDQIEHIAALRGLAKREAELRLAKIGKR